MLSKGSKSRSMRSGKGVETPTSAETTVFSVRKAAGNVSPKKLGEVVRAGTGNCWTGPSGELSSTKGIIQTSPQI
jgi:hypothetical protein